MLRSSLWLKVHGEPLNGRLLMRSNVAVTAFSHRNAKLGPEDCSYQLGLLQDIDCRRKG
jgi:hypothetical protein